MKSSVRNRLFVMMVLEFFVWGAWLPLVWPYMGELGFTPIQIALVGSAFAIAGVVAIFFGNQFADRNFAAEKFLAFSHLIGGLAMLGLFWTKSFPLFFTLMLIHSLFYVPTISVANSIAFANLKDAQKEFGLVRMGGHHRLDPGLLPALVRPQGPAGRGPAGRPGLHLRGGGRRLLPARRLQPDACPTPRPSAPPARTTAWPGCAPPSCWPPPSCWCCSSSPSSTPPSTTATS